MGRLSCGNHLKAWRDTSPSCHALGTGLWGWLGTLQIWQIRLEKWSFWCLTPWCLCKESTAGRFFSLLSPIFSASKQKGTKQCSLGGLIIYHTAQTLDYQFIPVWAFTFICFLHLGQMVLLCCEILINLTGMSPILLHTQPKVRTQRELSDAD